MDTHELSYPSPRRRKKERYVDVDRSRSAVTRRREDDPENISDESETITPHSLRAADTTVAPLASYHFVLPASAEPTKASTKPRGREMIVEQSAEAKSLSQTHEPETHSPCPEEHKTNETKRDKKKEKEEKEKRLSRAIHTWIQGRVNAHHQRA